MDAYIRCRISKVVMFRSFILLSKIKSIKEVSLYSNLTPAQPFVDNEWKTRFETQQEMNNQLEKQVVLLREKLGQLKIPSRDGKLT